MSPDDVPSLNTNELVVESDEFISQGMEVIINKGSTDTKSEITSFKDHVSAYEYNVPHENDSTFSVADSSDVLLANFLSRPVKIREFRWSTSDPNISDEFNPWNDFYNDPRIANRIAHYALLRSTLKVKFLINGNAFLYGRLLASYNPFQLGDQITSVFNPGEQPQAVLETQRPHIYIDPCESTGGTMHLPFFFHKNAVHIPEEEYGALGTIRLRTLNNLKHANGASDTVSISVFAWAEDVSLAAPTNAVQSNLQPQADEYGTGPISKPATILSRVAAGLTTIPAIAPYARATEIATSAIARVASLAGYCRPNDISTISSFKPVFVGNMANTNVEDTAQKLTVDVKQELTLDPRTVGLSGQDELEVLSIVQRESYLTTFPWELSKQEGDPLWYSAVTPHLVNTTDSFSSGYLPALAFGTMPFQYWRGTIKFRFQIVASNFHRGRLRFAYEPYDNQPNSNSFVTNFNQIVDIASDKDFTLSIGWGSQTTYRTCPTANAYMVERYGTNYINLDDNQVSNGTIGVYVLNDLTVPNSTVNNDIKINVYVSAGDDFEVAAPWSGILNNSTFFPPPPEAAENFVSQAEAEGADVVESTDEPDAPMQQEENFTMAPSLNPTDMSNYVYFGEQIKSFRPLIKRYNFYTVVTPNYGQATGKRYWNFRHPSFPLPRGNVLDDQFHPGVGNVVTMTLLSYLSMAYTGWRGGVRWKYHLMRHPDGAVPSDATNSAITVWRGDVPLSTVTTITNSSTSVWVADGDFVADALANQNRNRTYLSGAISQAAQHNPVIEFETPFYSRYRFHPSKGFWNTGYDDELRPHQTFTTQVEVGRDLPELNTWVAAAEDTNLFFFTGCPELHILSLLS